VALLIDTVRLTNPFPVLYHFSSKRGADPKNNQLWGTAGLFVSLIEQLLVYMSHGNELDLEFLAKARRQLKARSETRTLHRTFQKLVRLLPPDNCLYIFVDSIWRYETTLQDKADTRALLKMVTKDDMQIKLVVTEPSSLGILEPLQMWEERSARKSRHKTKNTWESCILTLDVPGDVNEMRFNNTSWVKEEVRTLVAECISSQADPKRDHADTDGDFSTDEEWKRGRF
jgi:hypothetical protein